MKKYNLIILAGGEDEFWCQRYGCRKKAFLPIFEKTMLDWVIEAFHKSRYIDNIVVVGPRELSRLDSMRYVHKHLPESNSFIQNLLCAIFYIKTSIYRFSNNHNGYLISFCDAVFLTTDVIDATLKNIVDSDPEVALHYVPREVLLQGGYPAENRSYMQVAGGAYTGSNIYYIKRISKLLRVLNDLVLVRQYRKNPKKILEYIGCADKGVSEIEEVLSARLQTKVKIFISPYAQMGVDVDKPADYELAKIQFQKIHEKYTLSEKPTSPEAPVKLNEIDAKI